MVRRCEKARTPPEVDLIVTSPPGGSRGYKPTSEPVEYELHRKAREQHPHDPAGNV